MNDINKIFRVRYRLLAVSLLMMLVCLNACQESKPLQDVAVRHKAASAHPSVIELVADSQDKNVEGPIRRLVKDAGIPDGSVYRWKNRYFIFSIIEKKEAFISAVNKTLPTVQVREYPDHFYAFERSRCAPADTTGEAGEWEHILLTAALVPDTSLQRQYMDAHATQFEQWPEVAQGFCRAQFRQLLLYRKDNQLVLVISIPAGKTLDELNPLTAKDNPRVDEWNAQMKKYQTGIPGTDSSEVWVFPQVLK
ncbi:L-rhamnose mutarotase [Nostoc ellipsosporum NOK]|nr:L-rhamnose mutarotase [Nostoc ellipsosporum NOK]